MTGVNGRQTGQPRRKHWQSRERERERERESALAASLSASLLLFQSEREERRAEAAAAAAPAFFGASQKACGVEIEEPRPARAVVFA